MKTDNELIAEFMGFRLDSHEYEHRFAHHDDRGAILISRLEYATNWDWLMPVVEKISKTATYVPYFTKYEVGMDISIHPGACSFNLPDPSEGYNYVKRYYEAPSRFCHNEVAQPTIDCVYKCCVKFIRWYNDTLTVKKE